MNMPDEYRVESQRFVSSASSMAHAGGEKALLWVDTAQSPVGIMVIFLHFGDNTFKDSRGRTRIGVVKC